MNTAASIIKEGVEKRSYEIGMLLVSEESAPDVLKVLDQHKIEIKSDGPLRKIMLAYPIRKARQAFFTFFRVVALPEDIKLVERNLKSNPVIFRSLIIHMPKIKARREREKYGQQTSSAPLKRAGIMDQDSPSSDEPKVLSNEALEKKIEEILQ